MFCSGVDIGSLDQNKTRLYPDRTFQSVRDRVHAPRSDQSAGIDPTITSESSALATTTPTCNESCNTEQWQVCLTRQVEMCHALRHRPSSGVRTFPPLRFSEVLGESVDPNLNRVELIDDARQLNLHRVVAVSCPSGPTTLGRAMLMKAPRHWRRK